jgi:sulfur-carrier protein
MIVHVPDALRSYTGERRVPAQGATLGDALLDLDRRYPGLRFRVVDEQGGIRRHIRCFVNGSQAFDLSQPLAASDEVIFVLALSGG